MLFKLLKSPAVLVPGLLAAFIGFASAQEAKTEPPSPPTEAKGGGRAGAPPRGEASPAGRAAAERATPRRLPADVVTRHKLELPGGALAFTATAGKIVLEDAQGTAQGEIAFTAYALDGAEPRGRPVTFAVNGGPGASSAWLQIGALGPWRIAMGGEAATPSAAAALRDNPGSWLEFTDLVFIDPIGTGYSHGLAAPAATPSAGGGEEARRGRGGSASSGYWSVDGDIASLAEFVGRWLGKNARLGSPKFVIGESYGGFRGPKLVHELQTKQGVGINGLVLVSPVLDFAWLGEGGRNPMNWIVRLPTFAATVREGKGPVALKDLEDVERYATGDYLKDLLSGDRDKAAVARRAEQVAHITGLDPKLVLRHAGRISSDVFRRERDRGSGFVASAYDATDLIADPYPESSRNRADTGLGPLIAPFTTAMQELYGRRLNWQVEGRYHLLNTEVARAWNYGPGGRAEQESVGDLREALALDPKLRVLIAHGLSDLVTPYFQSKLILDQVPIIGGTDRVRLTAYGGGHMFYSRDASRAAFRADAQALYKSALDGWGK